MWGCFIFAESDKDWTLLFIFVVLYFSCKWREPFLLQNFVLVKRVIYHGFSLLVQNVSNVCFM
uniref:Putative ovule protein n=1 Tax=Solanum chacoense TaxID=4108 RepID=A0A0V0H3U4_SOLCH